VEIRFGGTIGQSINFKGSPRLSDESIDSIIEHLKDLTGATAKTLTVHTTVYNKIVSSGKDALITAKNWSLAKA
jgi:ribonuclease HIII